MQVVQFFLVAVVLTTSARAQWGPSNYTALPTQTAPPARFSPVEVNPQPTPLTSPPRQSSDQLQTKRVHLVLAAAIGKIHFERSQLHSVVCPGNRFGDRRAAPFRNLRR